MSAILDKIKALLAKAASTSNAHEAEAFAAKASELMEKYQVDIDAIRASDDPVGRDFGYTTKAKTMPWQGSVASAAAMYYGCRTILHTGSYDGSKVEFFGRESARITALEMLPYFIKTINWHAREMARETGWDSYKCAKQVGLEFAHRLRQLAPEMEVANGAVTGRNALVRVDEINAMVESLYPNLGKGRSRSFTTTAQARARANSIGLSGQMGGRSNALRIA